MWQKSFQGFAMQVNRDLYFSKQKEKPVAIKHNLSVRLEPSRTKSVSKPMPRLHSNPDVLNLPSVRG